MSVAITDPSRTGNLTVTMSGLLSMGQVGPVQPVSLGEVDNVGATPANSPYTFSYNLTSLPAPVSFSGVTATWNNLSVTAPPNFTTLGPYRFSQYNTPVESSNCGGSPAPAFVFESAACTYIATTMDSVFIPQTTVNGTGISANFGLLKAYQATLLFKNGCPFPEGSNPDPKTGNVFVKTSAVTGSCNSTFTYGTTIATNPNPNADPTGQWNCKDQVLLVNNNNSFDSIKTVQDLCPACSGDSRGASGHIDVYSSSQACTPHNAADYPNSPFYGIRLR